MSAPAESCLCCETWIRRSRRCTSTIACRKPNFDLVQPFCHGPACSFLQHITKSVFFDFNKSGRLAIARKRLVRSLHSARWKHFFNRFDQENLTDNTQPAFDGVIPNPRKLAVQSRFGRECKKDLPAPADAVLREVYEAIWWKLGDASANHHGAAPYFVSWGTSLLKTWNLLPTPTEKTVASVLSTRVNRTPPRTLQLPPILPTERDTWTRASLVIV